MKLSENCKFFHLRQSLSALSHCTISKHCKPKHKYDAVDDVVKQHKEEIAISLEPVEKEVSTARKTLEQIDTQIKELNDQQKDCVVSPLYQAIRSEVFVIRHPRYR